MIRSLIPTGLAIVLLVGAGVRCVEAADEKAGEAHTIKIRPVKQGDKFEVVVSETMNNELTYDGKTNKSKSEERYEYTEHVVELPGDAKQPTKLTRAYKVAKRTDLKSGELKSLSYEGKTLTVEKKDNAFVFSVDGKPVADPAELKELEGEFTKPDKDMTGAILPKQAVKVGDTWPPDEQAKKAVFAAAGPGLIAEKAKFDNKFTRAYTADGKPRGVISFEIELSYDEKPKGKEKQGAKGTVKIEGTFDAVIDGSVREGVLKGTTKMSVVTEQFKINAEGKHEKSVKQVK